MNKYTVILIIGLIVCITLSCSDDPIIDPPTEEEILQDTTMYKLVYGALPAPNLPEDNTMTEQGVELGRMLFYEKLLSKDGTQTCASCHRQEHGFSDSTRFSIGVEGLPGKRQAMSVFNMAWNSNEFFWDGRAHLLRDQAILPIQDELEMNETLENVLTKLNDTKIYRDQFTRVYGDDDITIDKMALAMEQFMLSIVSYDSKFDQWKAGTTELTESEERGRLLFETEYNPFFPEFSGADCAHCHGGANFENDLYMNNGLDEDSNFVDIGREAVSNDPMDRARFKVPTLRNIELTAPYMHDGRFSTLEEVVDHYNEGIHPSSTVDEAILATSETGLFLTEIDKVDLVNFLKTLTDDSFVNDQRYTDPF
ncbi:MAG: cytochrome c peroxidase [Saprospiraceae bacterium]|jgi:cytochrome c peroxidase